MISNQDCIIDYEYLKILIKLIVISSKSHLLVFVAIECLLSWFSKNLWLQKIRKNGMSGVIFESWGPKFHLSSTLQLNKRRFFGHFSNNNVGMRHFGQVFWA